jgi:anti-sigma-K factor RskA
MNEHLRQEEFIDAIEHTLNASRQAHLDGCGECRATVAELGGILKDAGSANMPEPSPLFWDHFSNRVREATALETMSVEQPWWHPRQWWRPVAIVASAAAAAALVIVLRPASTPAPTPAPNEIAALVTPPDDGSWGLVIGLASDLDAKDVREVAKPREGTADAMIAELTPAQRRALAQLIKDEIGEQ